MSTKLRIDDEKLDGFSIGWSVDDMEIDLHLGEVLQIHKSDPKEEQDSCREHNFVSEELRKLFPYDYRDSYGIFYWESMSAAKKALKAAKALLAQYKAEKPWPDWATKALSEGWKPPKNWRA